MAIKDPLSGLLMAPAEGPPETYGGILSPEEAELLKLLYPEPRPPTIPQVKGGDRFAAALAYAFGFPQLTGEIQRSRQYAQEAPEIYRQQVEKMKSRKAAYVLGALKTKGRELAGKTKEMEKTVTEAAKNAREKAEEEVINAREGLEAAIKDAANLGIAPEAAADTMSIRTSIARHMQAKQRQAEIVKSQQIEARGLDIQLKRKELAKEAPSKEDLVSPRQIASEYRKRIDDARSSIPAIRAQIKGIDEEGRLLMEGKRPISLRDLREIAIAEAKAGVFTPEDQASLLRLFDEEIGGIWARLMLKRTGGQEFVPIPEGIPGR
ncbi:MAG: hypothetical protein ACRD2L_00445 [Terriglobia bacterium]